MCGQPASHRVSRAGAQVQQGTRGDALEMSPPSLRATICQEPALWALDCDPEDRAWCQPGSCPRRLALTLRVLVHHIRRREGGGRCRGQGSGTFYARRGPRWRLGRPPSAVLAWGGLWGPDPITTVSPSWSYHHLWQRAGGRGAQPPIWGTPTLGIATRNVKVLMKAAARSGELSRPISQRFP